jgi:hypothetical protein
MFEQKDLRGLLGDAAKPKAKRKRAKRKTRHKAPRTKRHAVRASASAKPQRKHRAKKKKPHKRPITTAAGVQGRYAVSFCGAGNLSACRAALLTSLSEAVATPIDQVYADPTISSSACGFMGQQECFDSLRYRALGLETEPLVPWQNRPTQQQTVAIPTQLPR